jgi:DNA-binding transcriptional regulator YiaG
MSAHTKKHPISARSSNATVYITDRHKTYAIPRSIISKYVVDERPQRIEKKKTESLKTIFAKLDEKYTKAGSLLKGLRLREGLSQVKFAEKINVTQANLSNMENGRRSIGKNIAKRIEQIFGTNYRYFLE